MEQQVTVDSVHGVQYQLDKVRHALIDTLPFIKRLAIALYDSQTDCLTTYCYSSEQLSPLLNYQEKLANLPSLIACYSNAAPRVVDDITALTPYKKHTKALIDAGYRSSCTFPLTEDGNLSGFLFFNADKTAVFDQFVVSFLEPIAYLTSIAVAYELNRTKVLHSALKSAISLTNFRDPETGAHLERMARYAKIIAVAMASQHKLSDIQIQNIFLYAPLHDIGKIRIADAVLFKPDRLTESEFDQIKYHPQYGVEIIESLIDQFQLKSSVDYAMLKNIILYHHEQYDGHGYPDGLVGTQIPIEARIIAVADVFDALTSNRPYKKAWSNQKAFDYLKSKRQTQFDPECVQAFIQQQSDILAIQQTFLD